MIRRLFALSIALLAAGSACAQGVLPPFVISDCYSLARGSATLSDDSSAGAANAAILQDAQDRQGYGSGARVRKGIYIPPGCWPIHTVTLGTNAAGDAARAGLAIVTGGGAGVGLNRNHNTVGSGNITRLYYTGAKDANNHAINYYGAGCWISPLELCGISLVDGTDYTNRDTSHTKTPVGIYVHSLDTSGVPNGRIFASHILLQGFEKGVYVYQSDTGGNNDNLTWYSLDFDACDVGYEVNSTQSVTHLIGKVHTNYYVDTIFKFIKGGDLHCWSCQVNNPNCTILDLSGMTYDVAWGNFEVRNVRLDNNADSPVLVKLNTYSGTPRNVIITGTIGSGCTYTTADLVQGENAADRIFIRFTGSSQAVTDLNGQSTVSEAPF